MNDKEKKLAIKIKNAIDQVWCDYYVEENIKSGDIAPLEVQKYCDNIEELANIIYQVGEGNKEISRRVFKVTIEEHISETYEVEATDIEEAMQLAEERYYKGEYVLDSEANVSARLMSAEDDNGDFTEWVEF